MGKADARERERSIERRCQVLILELKGGLGGLECGGAAVGQMDGQTTAHQHQHCNQN